MLGRIFPIVIMFLAFKAFSGELYTNGNCYLSFEENDEGVLKLKEIRYPTCSFNSDLDLTYKEIDTLSFRSSEFKWGKIEINKEEYEAWLATANDQMLGMSSGAKAYIIVQGNPGDDVLDYRYLYGLPYLTLVDLKDTFVKTSQLPSDEYIFDLIQENNEPDLSFEQKCQMAEISATRKGRPECGKYFTNCDIQNVQKFPRANGGCEVKVSILGSSLIL